jgi:Na+-transporting methylmalonyl-CoA/oxaloacetate decarboxylase gamma subunit
MENLTQSEIIWRAITYSCIAFSIVFLVLGLLTAVIYAMRLTSKETPPASGADDDLGGEAKVSAAVPANAPQADTAGVKSRHVAAITAAILALTQGRGRILSITPAAAGNNFLREATRLWRSTAIVRNVGRRLPAAWKR